MLWLGWGTKNTWLGLGENRTLATPFWSAQSCMETKTASFGCNKNTWKHSLMALENIRQCDSNFGNGWLLVINQTFLILAQFNNLCGMKEEKKSRIHLRITTPGRNIAGSAVNLHLKREQLCSNGSKCGPLQRPEISQQFEHSTVTVLAALFGNNINDTQWSRWQL